MATGILTDSDEKVPISDEALRKRHVKALAGFKASASFFTEQRKRELQDLKFVDFDEQWDPLVKTERGGGQAIGGNPVVPPKPTLTINQLRPVCHQVAATRRQANLALEFIAKGNGANDDTAEIFEDIARGIQQDSRADIARNWAADRAEKAGLGWYRIDTEYCTDSTEGPGWQDQQIVYRRILNQSSVYPDPLAQEPDFSDGRRLYVTEDMPWDLYKSEYGDSYLAGAEDSDELTAIGDEHKEWIFYADAEDDQTRTVRVAECWEVVDTRRKKVALKDGTSAFEDEVDEDDIATGDEARQRYIMDRKVYWSKMNGVEYLDEPQEWNGRYIPIVPVIWEEANVAGERRWTGIVRPGKDAAISYNVMRSAQVTAVGLATKAPYIGYWKSVEPYQDFWNQSSTRNFPMLPLAEAYDKAGNALPIPQRTAFEPAIQGITIAAQAAKDDVHATTGIPPVALGDLDPTNRSGAAIKALQGQSEQGASVGLDNLRTITLPYDGKVMRDLIPRIYDRPGRMVSAVGEDATRKMIMLGMPFTTDQMGMPVGVPNWHPGDPVPPGATFYDLAQGEYGVTATVGKSHPTQKKEASEAIGNVLQVVPPEFAMAIVPAWLEEQDYPGAKKIAAIAKKALPPNLAAAYQADGALPDPRQLMAQVQALNQTVQQLQQVIQTDEAKAMAKAKANIMEAQAESQLPPSSADRVKLQIADMTSARSAQAGISEAAIKAQDSERDRWIQLLEIQLNLAKEERLADKQVAHEQGAQGADHRHEAVMTALGHTHEHAMADQAASNAQALAATGAQHDQNLAVTHAALQPTPNEDTNDGA